MFEMIPSLCFSPIRASRDSAHDVDDQSNKKARGAVNRRPFHLNIHPCVLDIFKLNDGSFAYRHFDAVKCFCMFCFFQPRPPKPVHALLSPQPRRCFFLYFHQYSHFWPVISFSSNMRVQSKGEEMLGGTNTCRTTSYEDFSDIPPFDKSSYNFRSIITVFFQ